MNVEAHMVYVWRLSSEEDAVVMAALKMYAANANSAYAQTMVLQREGPPKPLHPLATPNEAITTNVTLTIPEATPKPTKIDAAAEARRRKAAASMGVWTGGAIANHEGSDTEK